MINNVYGSVQQYCLKNNKNYQIDNKILLAQYQQDYCQFNIVFYYYDCGFSFGVCIFMTHLTGIFGLSVTYISLLFIYRGTYELCTL